MKLISTRRRGTVLVAVLVALLVVTAMYGWTLRTAGTLRRQTVIWRQREQAAWLTQSGVNRAVWQLQQDANYRGELWQPLDNRLGPADVQITVTVPTPGSASIAVETRWPSASPQPLVHRQRVQASWPQRDDTSARTEVAGH